ncbi:MAG: dihydroorotate dehydrogenase [Ignavibacteriaceae bacterium]|jgi:dihydroorotate dehydrogenase (NAD+) catalytic subunit|nr:dihydroorotate dehydrogenase [Ignavibacteriaceae bacterium]HPO56205.1 dihydroorotate dehydrogenase [Ignavibacteriaceae bacterium]
MNQNITVGRLNLKNPVLLASGTVGYGNEIAEFLDLNKIGGIVTKSISLKPRAGNPPPRIVETASGMLNAIGLANVGLEKFITEKLPYLEQYDTAVICNIAASTVEEYVICTEQLAHQKRIDAFEINVSCPNVKEGGLVFGNNLEKVIEVTEKVRKATTKPLFIKLSPNVPNIADFAKGAVDAGADAVSAVNTFVGAAIDLRTRKPKLHNVTGGLSGPAIKPLAVAKVLEISRKHPEIDIIGIGGISNWKDAVEFILAGAKAVQIGTVNFVEPAAGIEIADGIREYFKNE